MPDIEFDGPADPAGAPQAALPAQQPEAGPRYENGPSPTNPLVWGAVLAWIAAAVLAVTAPFRPIYSVASTGLAGASHQSLDGWGRYSGFTAAALPAGSHATRYGIAFCVAAALLLVCAVGALVAARRLHSGSMTDGVRAAVLPVATVAATVLATLTAVQYLLVDSLSDSVAAQTTGGIEQLRPQLKTGGNVWLGVAATGFAIVALALYLAAARSATAVSGDAAPAAEPDPDDALDPADEQR